MLRGDESLQRLSRSPLLAASPTFSFINLVVTTRLEEEISLYCPTFVVEKLDIGPQAPPPSRNRRSGWPAALDARPGRPSPPLGSAVVRPLAGRCRRG